MLTLAAISILVGLVLGLRFKVFILAPTIGLALPMVAVNGIARGDSIWRLVATMVVVATSLQLSYLGGSVLQFVIGAARATNHGKASMPTSAGPSHSARLTMASPHPSVRAWHTGAASPVRKHPISD